MTTLPAESHPGAGQARACLVRLAGDRFAVEIRHAREVVVFDVRRILAALGGPIQAAERAFVRLIVSLAARGAGIEPTEARS